MSRRNNGPRLKFFEDRGAWHICWTDPKQPGRSRKCSTGTADREQAEKFRGEWLITHGQRAAAGPRDPSLILVTAVLQEYLLAAKPSAQGRIAYAVLALTEFFAENTGADVTKQSCKRYAQARSRSMGTVRRELGAPRAAINHAFSEGRLTRKVAVHLPERSPARDRWLTREEAASVIKASKTPQARLYLPLFILIGLYTGRRKEAILSLRWPQVDPKAKLIDFEVEGREQTNKKRGKVRIPDRLLPHLVRARRRGTELGYVLHDHGKRIADVKKGFAAACRRAGLERVMPHTLRHTAATWLMKAGVPIWEASQFLSMSEETLTRVYAHHHPEFTQGAADAIGRRPTMVRHGA
jgi:integrase